MPQPPRGRRGDLLQALGHAGTSAAGGELVDGSFTVHYDADGHILHIEEQNIGPLRRGSYVVSSWADEDGGAEKGEGVAVIVDFLRNDQNPVDPLIVIKWFVRPGEWLTRKAQHNGVYVLKDEDENGQPVTVPASTISRPTVVHENKERWSAHGSSDGEYYKFKLLSYCNGCARKQTRMGGLPCSARFLQTHTQLCPALQQAPICSSPQDL